MGVQEVILWPCNERAWACWCALQTQWRVGMGGASGLDYGSVLAYLRHVECLQGTELAETFQAIQAAEHAVLELRAEQAG